VRHAAAPRTDTPPASTISTAAGQYFPSTPLTSQLATIGSSPPPSTAEVWKHSEMPL
jgi:hypothetical protein